MKKSIGILVLSLLTLTSLSFEGPTKQIDLRKALTFAKGEKYRMEVKAKFGMSEGEQKENGDIQFVLTNSIVALDAGNNPSEYLIVPVAATITVNDKVEKHDFKDNEESLRIARKGDRWEVRDPENDTNNDPLCWLVLCQSPELARMLFPAKPVRPGDQWDADISAIEQYVATMFDLKSAKAKEDHPARNADLKTATWKATGKLVKVEGTNAVVEFSLKGSLKLDNDDMSDIEIAGDITLTVDLEKSMISKVDGKFTADFKGEEHAHVEVSGSVSIEKAK